MLNKKIEYSRHAKRRMKLYNLSEEDVSSIVKQSGSKTASQQEKNVIVSDNMLSEYGLPVKVVYTCDRDRIVVITAYPLKRRTNQ
jgi:hypothetical protein